jgi:hypothetical protein
MGTCQYNLFYLLGDNMANKKIGIFPTSFYLNTKSLITSFPKSSLIILMIFCLP